MLSTTTKTEILSTFPIIGCLSSKLIVHLSHSNIIIISVKRVQWSGSVILFTFSMTSTSVIGLGFCTFLKSFGEFVMAVNAKQLKHSEVHMCTFCMCKSGLVNFSEQLLHFKVLYPLPFTIRRNVGFGYPRIVFV